MTEASTSRLGDVVAARRRGLSITERRLLLAGVDAALVAAAFVIAFNIRTAPARDAGFYIPRLGTVVTVISWLICAHVAGAYDLRGTRRIADILRVTGTALAGTLVVLLGVFFIVPYRITRPTLLLWVPLAFTGVLAGRLAYRRLAVHSEGASRIALVARREVMQDVWPQVSPHLCDLYRVAAVVDPDRDDCAARLAEAVTGRRVDHVVLGVRDEVGAALFASVLDCHNHGVRVRTLADLHEELTGRLLLEQLGHTWITALPMRDATSRLYAAFKRSVDVVAGVSGLVLLGVVLPFAALAIKLEDGGAVFHSQPRIGRYGRPFLLTKLRTMRGDPAGQAGGAWTESGDARITHIGGVLRRLHIDELPQGWSIVRGRMSLIGPRPEQPRYVEMLSAQVPFYGTRHTMRPGLTGWAQVNEGYCSGVDGSRIKLSYDLYYAKHQSMALDALILGRTVLHVLRLGGR